MAFIHVRFLSRRCVYLARLSRMGHSLQAMEAGGFKTSRRFSSSDDKGFFGRVRDTVSAPFTSPGSTSKDEIAKRFKESVDLMLGSENWTLEAFSNNVEAVFSNWRAKIPFLNSTPEIQDAKEKQKIINAMIEVVGKDASPEELSTLGKKEKLQLCLKSGASVSEIDAVIEQFKTMSLLHHILKQRKLEGKAPPSDEFTLQAIMQSDGHKYLTKQQKRDMREAQMKNMKRSIR